MRKLQDLFFETKRNSSKWDSYFDVYERHLSKFVNKSPRILEIGILEGGSIELWHNYFGKGTSITAIDVDQRCSSYQYDFPVDIVIGDQGSEEFWNDLFTKRGSYDIIIDDGGHRMDQQIVTLKKSFPYLNDSGYFITEDTHTSYWKEWGGSFDGNNTFLSYSKKLTDFVNVVDKHHFDPNFLNVTEREIFQDLYSVSFYSSLVLFEKRKNQTFVNITSHQNRN